VQSPSLPPAIEYLPSDYNSTEYKGSGEFRRGRYTDDQWEVNQTRNGPNKIKPYLRKLSSKDDNRIDLSRTTEENEKIAGLGIGEIPLRPTSKSASDVTFSRVDGRTRHGRAASNGSQFSVTSLQKPTAPYAHPMRQTPRPYTPPIARSYANSVMTADANDEPTDLITIDDIRPRLYSESHHRTDSVGSLPLHPPPLQTYHSSNSFTRLNASQSSIPSILPTGGRSRGDTLRSIDTLNTLNSPSGSGRPSFDKAVSFLHKGRSHDENESEASRAASIRALRAAYNEKEEAKEAKYAAQANKRIQKEERIRRKSDTTPTTQRVKSNGTKDEKARIMGKAYDDYSATHASSLPNVTSEKSRPRGNTNTSSNSGTKGPKSNWVRFVAWLKTRLLRWGSDK
jgi:hypothetical protein